MHPLDVDHVERSIQEALVSAQPVDNRSHQPVLAIWHGDELQTIRKLYQLRGDARTEEKGAANFIRTLKTSWRMIVRSMS